MYIRRNVTHNHDFQALFVIIRPALQEHFFLLEIARDLTARISNKWKKMKVNEQQGRQECNMEGATSRAATG